MPTRPCRAAPGPHAAQRPRKGNKTVLRVTSDTQILPGRNTDRQTDRRDFACPLAEQSCPAVCYRDGHTAHTQAQPRGGLEGPDRGGTTGVLGPFGYQGRPGTGFQPRPLEDGRAGAPGRVRVQVAVDGTEPAGTERALVVRAGPPPPHSPPPEQTPGALVVRARPPPPEQTPGGLVREGWGPASTRSDPWGTHPCGLGAFLHPSRPLGAVELQRTSRDHGDPPSLGLPFLTLTGQPPPRRAP